MNAESKPRETSSEVVANWLNIFEQVYREERSEELVLAYQIALEEVRPDILHKAFLRAMKKSKFRPTPAEIALAADIEYELQPRRPQLVEPKLTEAERLAALEDPQYKELRDKILAPGEPLRNPDGSHTPRCLCRRCRIRREKKK